LDNITYLLPKNNFRINQFNYHSFAMIFQCYRYKAGETIKFSLIKPAIVSPITMGKNWKLKETGIVQFSSWQDSDVFENIEVSPTTEEPEISKNTTQKQSQHREISLTIEEDEFIKGYNAYQQNIPPSNAIEVNATENSINMNHLGGQDIFLTKIPRGQYWIVNRGGFSYLVTKKNLVINQHNYSEAEALFECREYQQERSQKFSLQKPAKVSELPEGEKWRLEAKGILEFY
jgi:hypothetical protein